ncbi:MAG: DNA mismatch repair endonuclease MutL, partial [Ignavibacteriae bacterium]|nr:DNA mismatch repair endonuclease MutL [Ignavibacteriota bacterium]
MTHRRIQVLPEHLANKIAAGEVIQRPESVVKELLENSLDAGAKHLTVVIKDGGKELIQVVDDGIGMDEEDSVRSFQRHATSKIATYEDLEAINTYGFRGEALASIAAVARVALKTRTLDDDVAIVVSIDGGDKPRVSREGRNPGTSISVQNLFYNVPARRKFLKSTNTEFRHVYDVIQRFALSCPEVALQFVSDDETILDVKSSTVQERVIDIFGVRQSEALVWLEERTEFLSVSGYIGKPMFGQKSRANQFLFLNRRYITNRNISYAVFSAYENLMIKGSHPFFLLFLEIDPHRVDVNVHPSKMEAKFEDEQSIYRFVSTVVRKTLATNNLVPSASLTAEEGADARVGLRFTPRQHSWPQQTFNPSTGEILSPRTTRISMEQQSVPPTGFDVSEKLLGSSESDLVHSGAERGKPEEVSPTSYPLIWQVHKKYILAQVENGLLIVDQHVAHERIIYERALKRFETNQTATQQLLFPQSIEFSPGDFALFTELHRYFEQIGFAIKPFGRNTVLVEGVPPDLREGCETSIIKELLSLYREYQQAGTMASRDSLAKSFSCKAAIKAGDKLDEAEMRSLIDQLFATKMPYVCPHGRP